MDNIKLKVIIFIIYSFTFILSCSNKNNVGKNVVRYQFWDITYNETFEALKKAFEDKNPDIKVVSEIIPFSQYWTKMQTAASSGNMADIFWMNFPNTPKYMSANIMEPLSFVNEDQHMKEYMNYIPNSAREIYRIDGNYYAIPKGMDTIVCFINTKLFEDAGVQLPKEDWTLGDLIKIAEELQPKLPKNCYVYGLELNEQSGYLPYIFGMGGYDLKDGTNVGLDNPKTIEGIELFAKIMNEKWSGDPKAERPSREDYMAGRQAILQDLSTIVYKVGKVPELAEKTIIIPLPRLKEGNLSTFHSVGDSVYSKSKNKEMSIKFLKFINSPEGLEIQAKTSIFFPLTQPYINIQTESLQFREESISNIVYMCNNGFPYPSTLEFDKYYKDLDTAVKSIVTENKPAGDTLKSASLRIRGYLK